MLNILNYQQLPVGFGSHLDVAFFTHRRVKLLGDPGAGARLGNHPLAKPSALVGLGAINGPTKARLYNSR
ncbi:MAG: hypothetical protein ACFB2W_11995 [Leptolyngbyaceae cyanobacterium]